MFKELIGIDSILKTAESNVMGSDTKISKPIPGSQNDQSANRGATLVEYVLLLALVTLICIGAIQLVGSRISQRFSRVASVLEAAP